MHRIDTPTAQIDKFGQGKNGFTNGDLTTGRRSTYLNSDMWDAIQEEVCTVIERSGLALNKAQHDQLYKAIMRLIVSQLPGVGQTNGTVAAGNDSRIVGALQATQNLLELTNKTTARNNLGLGSAATKDVGTGTGQLPDMSTFTLSALSASSGYQKLPSGLILQWTIGRASTSEDTQTVTFPVAFPNALWAGFVSTNANSGNQSDIMYQTSGSTRSSITLQAQIFTTAAAAGSVSPVIFAIGF